MLETHVTIYSLDDTLLHALVEYGDGSTSSLYMNGEDIGGGIYKYSDSAFHILISTGTYLIWCTSGSMIPDIVNIADSETKNFYMQMLINFTDESNTAPVFLSAVNDFSTVDFCTVLHSEDAYDFEGDSLAYAMSDFRVEYDEPYDGYIPWASDTIYFDAVTGLFHWESPPSPGLYGLAFQTSEYRDGILLGTSERKYVTEADCFVSSVFNNVQSQELLIYPNPASDFITLQSAFKSNEIHIYNVQGNEVDLINETTNNKIDISHLPANLYFILIKNSSGNDVAFSKFIKL